MPSERNGRVFGETSCARNIDHLSGVLRFMLGALFHFRVGTSVYHFPKLGLNVFFFGKKVMFFFDLCNQKLQAQLFFRILNFIITDQKLEALFLNICDALGNQVSISTY